MTSVSFLFKSVGKENEKLVLNVPRLYRARMKKSKFGNILAKKI